MKIRPIKYEDLEMVEKWIAKDETHKALGITIADVVEKNTAAFLVSDDNDNPLMVIRLHAALRAAIQFNPNTSYRNAKVAPDVINWMKDTAKTLGATEVIIRPGGKAVKFSKKLGFLDFIGKYIGV